MDPAGAMQRIVQDPHRVIEVVTPQRDLFVRAHLGTPRVDPAQWRLEIAGPSSRMRSG